MKTAWRRKPNRLAPSEYVGNRAYFVTSVVEGRVLHFFDESLIDSCLSSLESAAAAEGFRVLAYVFMPDHMHLLVHGTEASSLAMFMKRFKQQTSFWFKQRSGTVLWQKSYHDHIVRREEDLNDIALYIAGNPVRTGFVEEWPDYLHWGGDLLRGAVGGDLKVAATGGKDRSV